MKAGLKEYKSPVSALGTGSETVLSANERRMLFTKRVDEKRNRGELSTGKTLSNTQSIL
jgi:hypothetical protein